MRTPSRIATPLFGLMCLALAGICVPVPAAETAPPERIVSMAPSTTEILFELDLGDKVVGVTRYCDYPDAAKDIDKIGGYVDPSYEAVVALKPDLVVLLTSHRDAERELRALEVPTLVTPHETIPDIHEAIRAIGEACGRAVRAEEIVASLESRTRAVRKAVKDKPKPTVLICVGRDTESGALAGMYMAGRNGFYDEMVELVGGVNAYRDKTVPYPQLSAEGVIQLNPDVIIDLVSEIDPEGKTAKEIAAQWNQLRTVSAVREKRVYAIVGTHGLRPGPRYARFLVELARLLHPGSFKKEDAGE